MKKLKHFWRWYVSGGIPEGASIGDVRKIKFINIVDLLGFVATVLFATSDIHRYIVVGTFETISAFLFFLSMLALRLWRKAEIAKNITLLSVFIVVMMLVVTGGGDGAGVLWVLVFPPTLFFLEERRASFVWMGAALVTITLLFATGNFYEGYDKFYFQHLCYSLIVIGLVAYYYQKVNLDAEAANEKIKQELFEGNKKLAQVNKELEQAKAHVEEQVVERTRSLVKEHARLEASVGSLPLGLILTNRDFFISSINSEAEKILTTDTERIGGGSESYAEILRDDLRLGPAVNKAIEQKRRLDLPEKIYRDRFIQLTVAPIILHDAPQAIGAIILLEDVTEKKIVARARDEFFLVASHELRTPLTIVEGNISIIKEHFLAEIKNNELNHMIENAYDSTKRLIYIVNQLLQVSAIELGEVKLNIRSINLFDICQSSLQKYQKNAKQKDLTMKAEADNKAIEAEVDSELLDKILSALIDNAIRNTEKGGVRLVVSQQSDRAQIQIIDTGRGISNDNQALLFHKFHQSGSDIMTRDSAQSIGLGLYLAKLMTEKMAGKIYLKESSPGKGSTFILELPLVSSTD